VGAVHVRFLCCFCLHKCCALICDFDIFGTIKSQKKQGFSFFTGLVQKACLVHDFETLIKVVVWPLFLIVVANHQAFGGSYWFLDLLMGSHYLMSANNPII